MSDRIDLIRNSAQFYPTVVADALEGADTDGVRKQFIAAFGDRKDVNAFLLDAGFENSPATRVGAALNTTHASVTSDMLGKIDGVYAWQREVRQNSDGCIFNGTWHGSDGGHAVYGRITQSPHSELYTAHIYNLGMGCSPEYQEGNKATCKVMLNISSEDTQRLLQSFYILGKGVVSKACANQFLEGCSTGKIPCLCTDDTEATVPTEIAGVGSEDGLPAALSPENITDVDVVNGRKDGFIIGRLGTVCGATVLDEMQTTGNCTGRSLEALVRDLILSNAGIGDRADDLEIQINLLHFYVSLRMLRDLISSLLVDGGAASTFAEVNAIAAQLNVLAQDFANLRHLIHSDETVRRIDFELREMRRIVMEALQNTVFAKGEGAFEPDRGKPLDLSLFLPPTPDLDSGDQAPRPPGSSPLSDSCDSIDAAAAALRECPVNDKAALQKIKAVFEKFDVVPDFSDKGQNEIVADAIKFLIQHPNLPLDELPTHLETYSEKDSIRLLQQLKNVSIFLSSHYPAPQLRQSVEDQNVFLTLEVISMLAFRHLCQMRQTAIKRDLVYYVEVNPNIFGLEIPPINPGSDHNTSEQNSVRRQKLAALSASSEKPGILLNAPKVSREAFAPVEASFASILNGPNQSYTAYKAACNEVLQSIKASADGMRTALDEIKKIKETLSRADVKKGKQRELNDAIEAIKRELANIETEKANREGEFARLKKVVGKAKKELEDAIEARSRCEKDEYYPAITNKERAAQNLQEFENAISRLRAREQEFGRCDARIKDYTAELKAVKDRQPTLLAEIAVLQSTFNQAKAKADIANREADAAKKKTAEAYRKLSAAAKSANPAARQEYEACLAAETKAATSATAALNKAAKAENALTKKTSELADLRNKETTAKDGIDSLQKKVAAIKQEVGEIKHQLGLTGGSLPETASDTEIDKKRNPLKTAAASANAEYDRINAIYCKLIDDETARRNAHTAAQNSVTNMEAFILALDKRKQYLESLLKRLSAVKDTVDKWEDVTSASGQALQKKLQRWVETYMVFALRRKAAADIQCKLINCTNSNTTINALTNVADMYVSALEAQVRTPDNIRLNPTKNEFSAEIQALQEEIRQGIPLPELAGLGNGASALINVANLRYTSNMSFWPDDDFSKTGNFDFTIEDRKSKIAGTDFATLDAEIRQIVASDSAAPRDLNLRILQGVFDQRAGLEDLVGRDTHLSDIAPKIGQITEKARVDFTRGLGAILGTPDSIGHRLHMLDTEFRKRFVANVTPMDACGLGDFPQIVSIFAEINQRSSGASKHHAQPQERDTPGQHGEGLSPKSYVDTPSTAMSQTPKIDHTATYASADRSTDLFLQNPDTIAGRTTANEKLRTQSASSGFMEYFSAEHMINTQHPPESITAILAKIADSTHLFKKMKDRGRTTTNALLSFIANDSFRQKALGNATLADYARILNQCNSLVTDTLGKVLIANEDNPLVRTYSDADVEVFSNIATVISAVMHMVGAKAVESIDGRECVLQGALLLSRQIRRALLVNKDNTDVTTKRGNSILAEATAQISEVAVRFGLTENDIRSKQECLYEYQEVVTDGLSAIMLFEKTPDGNLQRRSFIASSDRVYGWECADYAIDHLRQIITQHPTDPLVARLITGAIDFSARVRQPATTDVRKFQERQKEGPYEYPKDDRGQYTVDPSAASIFGRDGTEIFSFSRGWNEGAGVICNNAKKMLPEVLAAMPPDDANALMAFLKLNERSQVAVQEFNGQTIFTPADGTYAGEDIHLIRDSEGVVRATNGEGEIFYRLDKLYKDISEHDARCKLLKRGIAWGKKSIGGSSVYKLYTGRESSKCASFEVEVSNQGKTQAFFLEGSDRRLPAHIAKARSMGIALPGLENKDCICIFDEVPAEDAEVKIREVMLPDVVLNGHPLRMRKNANDEWEIIGIDNYRIATTKDIMSLAQTTHAGDGGFARETYPLASTAVITLIPINPPSTGSLPVLCLLSPVHEQTANTHTYPAKDALDFLPKKRSMRDLSAFTAYGLRAAPLRDGVQELFTVSCQEGNLHLVDANDAISRILQRITVAHSLLLLRKYDQAAIALNEVRKGVFLPNNAAGDYVRRCFAELVFSIRDRSPDATAIKFFALDLWRSIEKDESTIRKYIFEELPRVNFQGVKAAAGDMPAIAHCVHSCLTSLSVCVGDSRFQWRLVANLSLSKEQAISMLEKVPALLVEYPEMQGSPAATLMFAGKIKLEWKGLNSWGKVLNTARTAEWPSVRAERAGNPAVGPKVPKSDQFTAFVHFVGRPFAQISTRFGRTHSVRSVEIIATDADPAIQCAHDRMTEEMRAGARCFADREVFVPPTLEVTSEHLNYFKAVRELRDEVTRRKRDLLRETALKIGETNHGDLDMQAVARAILVVQPNIVNGMYRIGPTKFCPQFLLSEASYHYTTNLIRMYAVACVTERRCFDIEKHAKVLTNPDSCESERTSAFENIHRLTSEMCEFCSDSGGYIEDCLGKHISEDCMLCFAMAQGFIISKIQARILRCLMDGDYRCFKLMMGGGKSSVISLVLTFWCSLQGYLPTIACDSTQFLQAQAFWNASEKKFGQPVMTINPTRVELQSVGYLSNMLSSLIDAMTNGGILCCETNFFSKLELEIMDAIAARTATAELLAEAATTANEINEIVRQMDAIWQASEQEAGFQAELTHNLRQKLAEKRKRLERIEEKLEEYKDVETLKERFDYLVRIKKFFQEHGYGIFDEAHINLSARQEVNYPSGIQLAVPEELNGDVASIFKAIAAYNRANPSATGGLFGFANNSQAQRSDEDFVRDRRTLAQYLATCEIMPGMPVHVFLNKFNVNLGTFIDILIGESDAHPLIVAVGESGNDDDRAALRRICTWVAVTRRFESARHDEVNRKMGLHVRALGDDPVMVPYIASMTPSTNDFASLQEKLVNYYIQALIDMEEYFTPFTEKMIEAFTERMRTPIVKETMSKGPSDEEGSPSKVYRSIIGRQYHEVTKCLRERDSRPSEYQSCLAGINKHLEENPDARIALWQAFSGRSNRYHKSMHTDGCNSAVRLFGEHTMFCSGTISDVHGLPRGARDDTGVKQQAGVEGQIFLKELDDLTRGVAGIDILPDSGKEPDVKDLFASVPPAQRKFVRIIVDRGGVFKVKKINEILDQYAEALSDNGVNIIDWITYEDPGGGGFMAYDIRGHGANNKPLQGITSDDLRAAGLVPDACAAYYSERLSTGTDAQFIPNAGAIVTLNTGTNTPEELAQAVMRLRQFLVGQTASIAVTNCPQAKAIFALADASPADKFVGVLKLSARNEGENNKALRFQAAINEQKDIFKGIIADGILHLSFEEAMDVRQIFDHLFTTQMGIDPVVENEFRAHLVRGSEILLASLNRQRELFQRALDDNVDLPCLAEIKKAYEAVMRPPANASDKGGKYHIYAKEVCERFSDVSFAAGANGPEGSGAQLEQTVENFVETEVLQVTQQNQNQNQMQQQSTMCQVNTTQTSCEGFETRQKVNYDLAEGFIANREHMIRVGSHMIKFSSDDGGNPNPFDLINLYVSKNYIQPFMQRCEIFPFDHVGLPKYVAVDCNGNACVVDSMEASSYMKNAHSWKPGMPVLFSSTGTVLFGNPGSLPHKGEELFDAYFFFGYYDRIPAKWYRDRFMKDAKPGEFTPAAISAYVYLIAAANQLRRRNGLPELDESEETAICRLFTEDESTSGPSGMAKLSFAETCVATVSTTPNPNDVASLVSIMVQSDCLDKMPRDTVRKIPGPVLNSLPGDVFVRFCAYYPDDIELSQLETKQILIYEMIISGRPFNPEEIDRFCDKIHLAAETFLSLEAMEKDDAAGSIASQIIKAMETQLKMNATAFLDNVILCVADAIRIFAYAKSDSYDLTPPERAEAQDELIAYFEKEIRGVDFNPNDVRLDGLQDMVHGALMRATEKCKRTCENENVSQILNHAYVALESLFNRDYERISAEVATRNATIASLQASFSFFRKTQALLAWMLVVVLGGFPLIFSVRDSAFDELLAIPFLQRSELGYIKRRIVQELRKDGSNFLPLLQLCVEKASEPPPDAINPKSEEPLIQFTMASDDATESVAKFDDFKGAVDWFGKAASIAKDDFTTFMRHTRAGIARLEELDTDSDAVPKASA
ncbi:MAG: hypothetical protein LBI34_03820 [Puniceicoccales bacterium]|jgi:hypothetical protein|nr:hypothetical protein [Puniceicoccales bacterium]